MPPHSAPAILDRLNEITFNDSVVLEINAIEAINGLLAELATSGVDYTGRFKPIRFHAIRNDAFVEQLRVHLKEQHVLDVPVVPT